MTLKRLLLLLLLTLTAWPVMAQTTTTTGTITDPQGNPYANGTASAQKSVATGQVQPPPVNVTTNGSGTFSMSLPSPASYIFTVCAPPTQIGPTGNPTPILVCFGNVNPIAVSGGSQDVSATLNAVAKNLGPNITGVSGVVATCTANQVPFYAVNGNVVACSSVITIAGTTATVQNEIVTGTDTVGVLSVGTTATITGALAANGGATVNNGITVNGGSALNGGGSDSGTWTHAGPHTFNGATMTVNSNATHNGTDTFTNTAGVINAGVFTNAATRFYLSSLLNGCDPTVEIGGNANAVQAVTGCVAVPAGTLNNNSAGIVGFANSLADSAGRTRGNAVGGYFQGRALANNSAIWGINPLATDAQGLTGHNITGAEIDVGISLGSTPAFVRGIAIISSNGTGGVGTPGTNSIGIELNSPAGGFVWNKAIMLDRGVSANGIVIDGNGFGGNNNSQSINFIGYDTGTNLPHQSSINGTSTGNVQLQPDVGGGYFALRSGGGLQLPGSTSGASNIIAPATGGGNQTLPQGNGTISNTIASGTAPMTTALITAGSCGTTVTASASGVATTDAIAFSFNTNPPVGSTNLILQSWPTLNNVNFQYCNPTAGNVTPSAGTLNWRVTR